MIMLVGLGNPGAKYAFNRHNIGFMAIDAIVEQQRLSPWRSRFQALVSEGSLDGEKCLCMKPQTFMNESGRAVGEAMRFYKLQPSDVVVFHDELDLPEGKLRIKAGGGHAGHNGLRSISAHIGETYRRVRLGIEHPGHKHLVHNHVLGDFSKADIEWLGPLLDAIAANAALLAKGQDSTFMNRVHLALNPAEPKPQGKNDKNEKAGDS